MPQALQWTILLLLLLAQLITARSPAQQVMGGSKKNMTYVHEKLAEAEIIPTVVDDFRPSLQLDVTWKSSSAKLGNTLNPSHLQSKPSVRFEKVASELNLMPQGAAHTTHVVALTDPDAPSRDNPEWSEFCHWIAVGVPGSSASGAPGLQLKDLVGYKPPGPPPKTGKHRYVFLVLVPINGTTDKLNLEPPKDRKHWGSDDEGHGVRQWARSHGLVPVAANFIYAQNKKQ
ncbi:carboxypeptidase Y inhibitor [Neonectria punicea]|uniref:Carboxypeptidase Y inhibitor n=1 Tax=Neonectria punicea TaxID=979145 RepID=A0ABR1GVV8_9HYPO